MDLSQSIIGMAPGILPGVVFCACFVRVLILIFHPVLIWFCSSYVHAAVACSDSVLSRFVQVLSALQCCRCIKDGYFFLDRASASPPASSSQATVSGFAGGTERASVTPLAHPAAGNCGRVSSQCSMYAPVPFPRYARRWLHQSPPTPPGISLWR